MALLLLITHNDIVQRTPLPLMFKFFRRKPPIARGLYIDGNLYMRSPEGVSVLLPSGTLQSCSEDHAAPNGVSILQIAYALALADGLLLLSDRTDFARDSRLWDQIRLN